MNIKGKQTVESFHKRLGKIMWDKCGMARNAEGLNLLGLARGIVDIANRARNKQLVPDERRRGVVVWMFELADAGVPPSDIATRAVAKRCCTRSRGC